MNQTFDDLSELVRSQINDAYTQFRTPRSIAGSPRLVRLILEPLYVNEPGVLEEALKRREVGVFFGLPVYLHDGPIEVYSTRNVNEEAI